MTQALSLFIESAACGQLAVRAVVLSGETPGSSICLTRAGAVAGSLGSARLDAAVHPLLEQALATQKSQRTVLELDATRVEILLDVTAPPPRLVVVGAVHSAIALVTFANALGFQSVVLDARAAFATPARFSHAHTLQVGWPADLLAALRLDETTYLAVLTHDAKIDDPALAYALTTPVRYIGALGSRRTHARRIESLRALGIADEAIARIHAPIGLDLGGDTPEELALAIMAEIVQVRNGRAGASVMP